MNNHYTRLFVAIILLAVSIICILTAYKSNKSELDKPKKVYKFEKKRLFVDLPEEKISNDENNPDTVVMFVRNDTLHVGYFSEY